MPLVLALEPDPRQAAALKPILERRVGAELVLADSKDSAIAVLNERIPDLILVTALLSPRDEAELNEHLRTLDGASHLQTLTIPLLGGAGAKPAKKKRGLLGALTGQSDASPTAGCDPAVFAEQIRSYIDHAQQLKAEAAAAPKRKPMAADPAAALPGTAATDDFSASSWGSWDQPAAPGEAAPKPSTSSASSSYWDWDAPAAGPAAAPVAPPPGPRPADALFQFEDTRSDADIEDPDALSLRLDQHASGVLDAGDRLLQQPAGEETESPAASLEALSEAPAQESPGEIAAPEPSRSKRRKKTRAERQAPTGDSEAPREIVVDPGEAERQDQLAREAEERGRLAAEQAAEEAARERERLEREAGERERIAREEEEARARVAREEAERERAERERIAREAEELERLAQEEAAREAEERQRLAREAEERERQAREEAARERAERERLALEAAERERLAREAQERERLAREEAARERSERERIAREAEERERLAREAERREQLARLEAARERLQRERLARETAERERQARERAERERLERERLAREVEERERRAREQAERERAERERLAREAEERERLAREFAERERLAREEAARERAERERLAREAEERERIAREEAARERAERERLEAEAARERAERERLAREAEERERLAREEAARERAERERLAREAEERERQAREEAARERAERERLTQEAEQWARLNREQEERAAEAVTARGTEGAGPKTAPEKQEAPARKRDEPDADHERLVRELAAQAQALAAAVKAAQQLQTQQPPPAPHKPPRLRRERPQRAPKKKPRARKPAPNDKLQDEWGLYDPQMCGFDALYARLEEDEHEALRDEDEPSATELLMRASKRDRNGHRARESRGPAPLAVWARRETSPGESDASTVNGNGHAIHAAGFSVFNAILGGLNLPAPVAAVSYGSGCRIGRVKVRASRGRKRAVNGKAAGKKGKKDRKAAPEPLIILSRKILENLRGKPDSSPSRSQP